MGVSMSIRRLLEAKLKSLMPDEDYSRIKYDVNKKTGCWEVHDRAKNKDGYPVARIKGKLDTLYRHFYKRYKGDIDDGIVIRHTCDNRLCCNPEHLIPGTQKENVGDMLERDRFPKGIRHGRAKLNDNKVKRIKKDYFKKNKTISAISREYEVDRKTIHKIVNGITWVGVGDIKEDK
jgi:hypothetical protein